MAVENVLDQKRVQEILQGLTKGLTREELAQQFGHSNYKSMDIYMRRKGFEWDKETGNYRLRQEDCTYCSTHARGTKRKLHSS